MNKKEKTEHPFFLLHSVFFKISLLVFFASVIMIIFLSGTGSFFLHHQIPVNLQKSFSRYIKGIAEEIGIPPSIEKMEKTAAEYGLIILYKGPQFEYATGKPFLPGKEIIKKSTSPAMGTAGRYMYATEVFGEHRFLFASTFFLSRNFVDLFLLILIVFLTVIFFIIHQVIRRILYPVKYLVIAVDRVKAADFSYKIPSNNKDELGKLCHSFNTMTRMLEQMILSRERLLLDVSHELRSPVTRMKLSLEFLKDQKVKENLIDDLYAMEKMIEEILEVERIDRKGAGIQFEKTDIIPFIEDILSIYRHQTPALEFIKGSAPVFLICCRTKFKMLIRNLVENALRHSPGKPVTVCAGEDKGEILIEIQDGGEGIPGKDLPYIFEPFYRADSSRSRETGGYGLGLYLCKKIVQLHNGKIDIVSNPASGTKVAVRFAAAKD